MTSPFLVPMTTSDICAMVATVLIGAGLIGRIWYVEAIAEAIAEAQRDYYRQKGPTND